MVAGRPVYDDWAQEGRTRIDLPQTLLAMLDILRWSSKYTAGCYSLCDFSFSGESMSNRES